MGVDWKMEAHLKMEAKYWNEEKTPHRRQLMPGAQVQLKKYCNSFSVSHLQISTELSYIAVLFIVWRVQVLGFVLRIYVFELGGAVETLLADTFTSQFQDNCN